MTTCLLVRHGRSTANTAGVLAGRTPGIALDATGRDQAIDLGRRLVGIEPALCVTSPLERCVSTADLLLGAMNASPVRRVDERLSECDYGEWSNRALADLGGEPEWAVVQQTPSAAAFPGGERLADVSTRAVRAVREIDAELPADAVWVAVSHGDVIKSVLADALGLHQDQFQRLHVNPASLSVITWVDRRPRVLAVNAGATDLTSLVPRRASAEAAVGGGAGTEEPDRQRP